MDTNGLVSRKNLAATFYRYVTLLLDPMYAPNSTVLKRLMVNTQHDWTALLYAYLAEHRFDEYIAKDDIELLAYEWIVSKNIGMELNDLDLMNHLAIAKIDKQKLLVRG